MSNRFVAHRRQFLGMTSAGVILSSTGVSRALANGLFGNRRQEDEEKLIVRTSDPLNAEPPLPALVENWITPNDRFFVRSHAPAPELDIKSFKIEVKGMVRNAGAFTVGELSETFDAVEQNATLTCAGNRRSEHSKTRRVSGVSWGAGAIGNAKWGGIRLADVLRKAGVLEGAKHVWFESVDEIAKNGSTFPFGGSIPLEKAMAGSDDNPGAMIAFHMNGEPLPLDHGYPARMVVPGFIGARSVKWLGKIVVSDEPSPNHYIQKAYKVVKEDEADLWKAAEPIYQYVLNSVICTPAPKAELQPGNIQVSGYALPPGTFDARIMKVELSLDEGKTWRETKLDDNSEPFCWRLWQAEVPVTAETEALVVRAIDSLGRTQPIRIPWNAKGYLYNAWHRVPLDIE